MDTSVGLIFNKRCFGKDKNTDKSSGYLLLRNQGDRMTNKGWNNTDSLQLSQFNIAQFLVSLKPVFITGCHIAVLCNMPSSFFFCKAMLAWALGPP